MKSENGLRSETNLSYIC